MLDHEYESTIYAESALTAMQFDACLFRFNNLRN
jgi:hypothetical protein